MGAREERGGVEHQVFPGQWLQNITFYFPNSANWTCFVKRHVMGCLFNFYLIKIRFSDNFALFTFVNEKTYFCTVLLLLLIN